MCLASPTKRLVLVTTHTSQRRSTVSDIAYHPTFITDWQFRTVTATKEG